MSVGGPRDPTLPPLPMYQRSDELWVLAASLGESIMGVRKKGEGQGVYNGGKGL